MKNIVLVVLFLEICLGCQKEGNNGTNGTESITEKVWTLKYVQDTKTDFITYYPGNQKKITVEFTGDGELIFDGICNTGTGNYFVENEKITITSLAITKIYCNNINWESSATNGLTEAYQFRLSSRKLIILSNAGYNLAFE